MISPSSHYNYTNLSMYIPHRFKHQTNTHDANSLTLHGDKNVSSHEPNILRIKSNLSAQSLSTLFECSRENFVDTDSAMNQEIDGNTGGAENASLVHNNNLTQSVQSNPHAIKSDSLIESTNTMMTPADSKPPDSNRSSGLLHSNHVTTQPSLTCMHHVHKSHWTSYDGSKTRARFPLVFTDKNATGGHVINGSQSGLRKKKDGGKTKKTSQRAFGGKQNGIGPVVVVKEESNHHSIKAS